jgi:hypothetical protein
MQVKVAAARQSTTRSGGSSGCARSWIALSTGSPLRSPGPSRFCFPTRTSDPGLPERRPAESLLPVPPPGTEPRRDRGSALVLTRARCPNISVVGRVLPSAPRASEDVRKVGVWANLVLHDFILFGPGLQNLSIPARSVPTKATVEGVTTVQPAPRFAPQALGFTGFSASATAHSINPAMPQPRTAQSHPGRKCQGRDRFGRLALL